MSKLFKHLKIIRTHRKYVRKACFKMGIPWQGLIHDLSKYSWTELSIYKYYTGTKSPHEVCREKFGYSPCWTHHYHRNKHHWEFWLDSDDKGAFKPIKMPYKYIIESTCDMIGASKAYNSKNWDAKMPLTYWNAHNNDGRLMYKTSLALAKYLIIKLAKLGEYEFYRWYNSVKEQLKLSYENETLDKFMEEN